MKRCAPAVIVTVAALVLAGCTSGTGGHEHTSAPPPSSQRHSVPPSPTVTTTPAGPRAPSARTVTILGSGDVLIHPPLWQQARADAKAEGRHGYDFGPIYAGIAPVVRKADVAICELETPLAPARGPFTGWPDLDAPPQVLTALRKIGYDSCTTASNHTLDRGVAGVTRTLNDLDAAGLKHTGSARSAAEAARPLIITTWQGVKVAQLAYSFGFNGITVPAGEPWLANRIDIGRILAAAHRAKQAGAEIVVLSMHWGTEYDHLATQTQRQQAERLLASPDIDLILGDHAHVVQPMQRIHGKWVIYCMGNQISRHADPVTASREGVMPEVTFTEVSPGHFRTSAVRAIPTWMQIEPRLRLIDLRAAVDDPSTAAARRASYQRLIKQIGGYLDAYGAHIPL